jgi:hypothetical protein
MQTSLPPPHAVQGAQCPLLQSEPALHPKKSPHGAQLPPQSTHDSFWFLMPSVQVGGRLLQFVSPKVHNWLLTRIGIPSFSASSTSHVCWTEASSATIAAAASRVTGNRT